MKIRHILSFVCVLLLFSLGIENQVRVKIGDGVRMKIAGFGAEKVLNNEFETAGGGGADVFANWIEIAGGTCTVNQDNANEYSGANCCRFDLDPAGNDIYVHQTMTLGSNKRYKLSFWYYNSLAVKTAKFLVRDSASNIWLQSDGTWGGIGSIILANVLSWTKYEIEFVTHSDYTSYRVQLDRDLAGSSSIYYDLVRLRETPAKVFIGRLANGLYEAIGFKTPWLEGDNILEANK